MPAPGTSVGAGIGTRSSRKGLYSCDFCRLRKLRCDRPLPCTSCVSRGKKCQFGQEQQKQQASLDTPQATPQPLPSPQPASAAADQIWGSDGLLAEIQALRRLAEDLEKRVTMQNGSTHEHLHPSLLASPPPSSYTFTPVDAGLSPASGLVQVSEVVAHLERVSMGRSSQEPVYFDDLVIKVGPIRNIDFTAQPTRERYVWLPQHDEARVLLDHFITNVSYIHHVVHHPSLPVIVDEIYRQTTGSGPVKPSHLVLFLSILASATHVDNSAAHAHAQTRLWIRAAYDVLNSGEQGPPVALETIQGIVVLSFLVCNLEGVSLRYRSLISMGLLLSRELGLHCIDHVSASEAGRSSGAVSKVQSSIQTEMGRRVWWYLVATDWLMAARHGGPGEGVYLVNPRQMAVNKPRNIDDADLVEGVLGAEFPVTQPTEMSYLLQRIRLAEISRSIVDNPDTMTVDAELGQMISEIPAFLNIDSYEGTGTNVTHSSSGIFVQAYLLNSILHTLRCKLHLGYLNNSTRSNNDSTENSTSSREICLASARRIIHAEAQLERRQHPFALIRLRLSGIMYGVFMAGIVLLMDVCVNATNGEQEGDEIEMRRGEAFQALHIIENATNHSLAAANLHDSLVRVLDKHRAQQQEKAQDFVPESAFLPHGNQLAQSLEELMDFDGFQWDDLFSGGSSTSFF